MKKSIRVFSWIGLTLVLISPLQACSLIPKDGEHYQVQVTHKDLTADYSLAVVQIDDVTQTKEISCHYQQMQEEELSFSESGKDVGIVYVQKGDEVKKGEVLATLNTEDIENDLENLKDLLEKDQLLLKQVKEFEEFYQDKLDKGKCGIEEKEQYLGDLQDCGEKSREYTDDIALTKQKIESLQTELENSTIVAGMDGTVTYIWGDILSEQTEADQDVISIADTKDCAFQIDDIDSAEYLTVGQEVDIAVSEDKSYKATVSELDKENAKINLSIVDNDYTLDEGTRGVITLFLAKKEQVLTIPKAALHSTDDYDYVYYLDENGVRDYKKVSVGLVGDTLVEITDGLKENDAVITKSEGEHS
jgi:RND family efflux transporter MFP subunit